MPDSAADLVPPRPTLPKLREAAPARRACPFWGRRRPSSGPVHPRAILRQRDEESRHREMEAFVNDLKLVASVL